MSAWLIGLIAFGTVVAIAAASGSKVRLEFDSRRGADVPPITSGQVLQIRHAGDVLLSGEFRPD